MQLMLQCGLAPNALAQSNGEGHHWSSAITMATPIAHKGATAGAKAEALTLNDMIVKPELLAEAWT